MAWIDRQYDRENGGRYAEHVLASAKEFGDCWGDISPVGFVCVAWRLATAPQLDPGYVRLHRRVLSAECLRNEWDGSLVVRARLVAPWPEALAGDQVWQQDRGWRGWPEMFGQFLQPSQRELSRVPHVRSTLQVDAPVPLGPLPPVPDGPGPAMVELAERAVTVLTREIGDLLGPMVGRLEA